MLNWRHCPEPRLCFLRVESLWTMVCCVFKNQDIGGLSWHLDLQDMFKHILILLVFKTKFSIVSLSGCVFCRWFVIEYHNIKFGKKNKFHWEVISNLFFIYNPKSVYYKKCQKFGPKGKFFHKFSACYLAK